MMKVAFLDRDGVINVDHGYTHRIDDFEFTEGCIDALHLLQKHGFALIIVTNQSGIGRGYYTEQDYQRLTRWYTHYLAEKNITVTDVFHCPHAPEENCDCRKPKAGLFLQACGRYDVDLSSSLMIGDKVSDVAAAEMAGIGYRYLVDKGDVGKGHIGQGDSENKPLAAERYENLLQCVTSHCKKIVTIQQSR